MSQVGNVALTKLSTDSKIMVWVTTLTVQMVEYGFELYKQRVTAPA
ncbi:hypothetical protein [Streptomyces sp. NBC_00996]|nr:hypothetical protein OG390_41825 [Streptomyces sp. NBC_00996]